MMLAGGRPAILRKSVGAKALKMVFTQSHAAGKSTVNVEVPVADQLKYFYDIWGSDKTYNHMAVPWAWAFDTPFKYTKQIASHFGILAISAAAVIPQSTVMISLHLLT